MKKLRTFIITSIAIFLILFSNSILPQDVRVAPGTKMTIKSGTILKINNSNFVLQDDQTNAPSFINQGTLTFSGGGEAKVEQFIVKDSWHLVSAPVNDLIAGAYTGMYLYDYLEPSGFSFITSTSTPLPAGKGYFVWAYTTDPNGNPTPPDIAVLNGTLNQNDVTIPLSFTSSLSAPGWNLVGNPFPCSIDWNDHTDWIRTHVDATLYVYDPGTSGNYRQFNWNTGVGIPTENDGIVAATQGFWVKANASDASLTIPQSQRLHNNKMFYKGSSPVVSDLLRMKVSCASNPFFCESILAFHNESTSGYDGMFDSYFRNGIDAAPYLYTVIGGINYSMNFLSVNEERNIIPLYFEAPNKDLYFLNFFNVQSFAEGKKVYLEDRLLHKFENISQVKEYKFTADHQMDPHRFNIHIRFQELKKDQPIAGKTTIYSAHKTIYVLFSYEEFNTSIESADIRVYNLLGQKILEQRTYDTQTEINMAGHEKGPYIVKAFYRDTVETAKVFLY